MRQAVVVRDAPRNGADPLAIQALQPIGITHALRSAEIDAGVAELHASAAWGDSGALGHRDGTAVHCHFEQMNHGCSRSSPAVVWIDHRQAAAGGKPQAAIAGARAATAGGISGCALRASQPIRYAVIYRLHFLDLAVDQIPNVLLSDTADSSRSAQPQGPAAIILDVRDIVAQQAVASGYVIELAIAQRVQSASERADPQRAVRTLYQRTDLVARQAIRHRVEPELSLGAMSMVQPPQAVPVGA